MLQNTFSPLPTQQRASTPKRISPRRNLKKILLDKISQQIKKLQNSKSLAERSFGDFIDAPPQNDQLVQKFFDLMDLQSKGYLTSSNFNGKLLKNLGQQTLLGICQQMISVSGKIDVTGMKFFLQKQHLTGFFRTKVQQFL